MKKNLLIMMMMVLCAGFASAQTINTVHGFVPGGSTGDGDNATYVVFGVPFSTIDADGPKEMSVTLAQMQLVYDTVEDVISCGEAYNANGISLSADSIQSLVICNKEDNNQEGQRAYLKLQIPNGAQYRYDSLLVVNLYICPCTKTDDESNDYDIIALDSKCWFKSNMRRKDGGKGLLYNSEMTEVQDDSVYGRLYTWETVLNSDVCDNDGYLRGICPDGWHLPTVEEMGYLFGTPAENLRIDGNWVVDGNNNITEFSAQPAGFYNASTQRYEGMFSETDFWMVNCNKLNEPQQEILQLVYSCNTPLRIVRPDEDALSVRCVYDIIKKLEDCDTNNNPDQYSCPSVSFTASDVLEQIRGSIASYGEIQEHISSIVFDGVVWGDYGARDSVKNQTITEITPDGQFIWQYPGGLSTDVMGVIGNIIITFDNGQVCKTAVNKQANVVVECPSVTVSPNHFDGIKGKITPYSPNDINNFQIKVSGSYTALNGQQQSNGQFTNVEVSLIDNIDEDGTFYWYLELDDDNLKVTGMSGTVTITGPLADCEADVQFNTVQTCSLEVGQPTYDNGVVTIPVANFYNYPSDDNRIDGTFYFNDNTGESIGDGVDAIIDTSDKGNGNADLIASIPSNFDIPTNAISLTFNLWFQLADEYYYCSEDDNGIPREVTAQLDNNNNNNNCPTYGTPNIVNNQYKIAVGNYTYNSQDAFTVTYVFDVGSVGQSQIDERQGSIYYDNGFLYTSLSDVPTNYCGLSLRIELNGDCQESLEIEYCN
jgi:uncharacterized protein (TIGR02145 family)